MKVMMNVVGDADLHRDYTSST
jgi:predicted dienelactone hydrolase